MEKITGFNKRTKQNLLLGAGAIYKNFNVDEDTYASATEKLLGATQGGSKFEAKPTVRAIPVDGVTGDAKGLQVIDKWDVTLTVNMLEASAEVLKTSLGAFKVDLESNEKYDVIKASDTIVDDNYIDNVTLIANKSGSDIPFIIQIFNALCTSGLTLDFKDNGNGIVAVTLKGYYGEDGKVPFAIYSPKQVA